MASSTGKASAPKAPTGLGREGRALWRKLTGEFEFDHREVVIVEQAARQADDVARLAATLDETGVIVEGAAGQPRMNALVTELRQGRLALGRLLGMLALPVDDEDGPVFTARSRAAQRASRARWDRERRRDVEAG